MPIRMFRIFALINAVLLFPASASAAWHLNLNYRPSFLADVKWWNGLGDAQKIAAVQSMIAAEEFTNGMAATFAVVDLERKPKTATALSALREHPMHFGRSTRTYVNEISAFYQRYPDSVIIVPSLLSCLADQPWDKSICHDVPTPKR